jgi:hypothetical protein
MSDYVQAEKNLYNELPIPTAWRQTLSSIADAIADGDYLLSRGVKGVASIDEETASAIASSILAYGVHLRALPEETWVTSVCQWMATYWSALVDLYSYEEGQSDLVLSVRVMEVETEYLFEVQSVYVP